MAAPSTRLGLLVCLGLSCATVEEVPEGPIVDSFKIEGVKKVKEGDLKEKVLTTESRVPWMPFIGRESHFDVNAWTSDQRRVERFYQAHGFYQARVVEEEITPTQEGHVALRLKVEEGLPTHVARFDVGGLEGLPEKHRQAVLEKLPVKLGRVFLEEQWNETLALLSQRLMELGYATAKGDSIKAEARVDVATQQADLAVNVAPGQRYKFGEISVSNPKGEVDRRLIRDQVLSVIEPHEDWFSPEQLEEAQARVFRMGLFSLVKVNPTAPEVDKGEVPISVDVREAPFTTWRGGGGFGFDQLRSEVRGIFLYENRNFLGGTRRLTVRARAGYVALAGSSTSGVFALVSVLGGESGSQHGPFGTITAQIEQPHFLHRSLAIQFTLEPSYQLEPAYRAAGGTARLGLVWRPTSRLTAETAYNFSLFRLSAPVAIGTTTSAFVGCGLNCLLHYVEERVAWDHRDDVLEPREGYYLALATQQGANSLEGNLFFGNIFLRVLPEARGYVSFFDKRFTIAARARIGLLISRAGVAPIPVRFFSGGNEMRGFSARRLSPFEIEGRTGCDDLAVDGAIARNAACPGNGNVVPVGGNTLLDGSLEFRWNVAESWVIATFVDAGYVTSAGLSLQLLRDLNVAVGIGVRLRTPIGPLRLDLAARLPIGAPLEQQGVLRPYQVNRGCYFGRLAGDSDIYPGSPESQCAFHLSVGEAF